MKGSTMALISSTRAGKTHLEGEEKKNFINMCYEIMNSQKVYFTDSKGSMAAVVERDGKLEVTTMSLNQVAEQVLIPCLPPEYSYFNRNQVVKFLKWFQTSITEWLRNVPEPDESLLKNVVYTDTTLTKYYEKLREVVECPISKD